MPLGNQKAVQGGSRSNDFNIRQRSKLSDVSAPSPGDACKYHTFLPCCTKKALKQLIQEEGIALSHFSVILCNFNKIAYHKAGFPKSDGDPLS